MTNRVRHLSDDRPKEQREQSLADKLFGEQEVEYSSLLSAIQTLTRRLSVVSTQ
jgi:hypothetical protein